MFSNGNQKDTYFFQCHGILQDNLRIIFSYINRVLQTVKNYLISKS